MRREALAKFGGRCAYCGSFRGRTVDHVRPLDRGGCDWPDNLLPSCSECNNAKANMTLEEFRTALYDVRFNLMPHKKTAYSGAGRRWTKLARKFTGEQVVFWFERVRRVSVVSTTSF
jgi:5-methylcytosine-specific restriction endonuclease McrA